MTGVEQIKTEQEEQAEKTMELFKKFIASEKNDEKRAKIVNQLCSKYPDLKNEITKLAEITKPNDDEPEESDYEDPDMIK